jgi:imidazolonepropionase-like amidohydrolase
MKKIFIYITVTLFSLQAFAQQPSKPQTKKVVIKNATIHIGNTDVLENASIQFENGKITALGKNGIDETNANVIDAKGKHVYQGLIAPYTKLGLEEIEAVRSTLDYEEVGSTNPNIRAIIAYNTDSKIIPTVRSNGVLTALVVPQGGSIPGSSSLVKMDGWNWEDAVYVQDIAIHVSWPRMQIYNAWWAPPADEQRKRTAEALTELKSFFDAAKAYNEQSTVKDINLKFEAMKTLFSGKRKLIIYANSAKEITSAVLFAKSYGINPIIAGASDACNVIPFLKEQNVSLILEQSHSLPNRDDDDVDLPYRRASILTKAGVLYCMGIQGSWQQRNLPFMAGTSAAYGISKEEALKSITLDAAKVLGVDKTLGSLELNKDATLIISDGDILDMRSSNVTMAFIKGAEIDLNNKQKELNELYKAKYQVR